MEDNKEYFVFISYSSLDNEWAIWLRHELEHYHLPASFNGRTDVRDNLRKVFRDRDELSAGPEWNEQVSKALAETNNLIVICSPNAAKSEAVNKEVEAFIALGKEDHIFPFIVEGDKPEDCFPPALKHSKLGGDVNKDGGRDSAFVKVVAGMLKVEFPSLWDRYEKEKAEEERKIREQRDNLLIMQSRFLAEKANDLVDKGDSYTARLLALEALPKDLENPDRPYVMEAEAALRKASLYNTGILRGHEDTVNALSLCGQVLLSGSLDRTIRIWDLNTGACLRIIDGGEKFSSLSFDGKRIFSGTEDGLICIWDYYTGKCIKKWKAHALRVNTIISFNDMVISCSNDARLCYWNIDNEDCKKLMKGYGFAIHGDILISYSRNKIYIYDLGNGTLRREIEIPFNLFHITNVAFDGQIIFSSHASGDICLWDSNTANLVGFLKGHEHEITSMVLDGNHLISSSKDKTIRIWNLELKTCCAVLEGHEGSVKSLADNHCQIFSSSRDKTIRIWDKPYKNNNFEIKDSGEGCVVTCSNKLLVSGYSEHSNKSVSIWDLNKNSQIGTLRAGPGNPSSLYVDDDIIICGSFKTVKIWNVCDLQLKGILKGHDGQICAIAYNGDILASGSWDNVILLWDLKKQICINKLHGHQASIRALTFCGEYLVSGSDDKTICVWNIQSGKCIRKIIGHENRISALAATSDNLIISGSWDASIRIWNLETGLCIKIFKEHTRVFSLVFDGKNIIVGTEDSLNVWNLLTGDRQQLFKSSIVHSVTYNGKNIYAGLYYASDILIHRFPTLEVLLLNMQLFCKSRQLSSEERKKYYLD